MTTFTASACGSTIAITPGEVFAIELTENPTTGYRWSFTADAGLTIVSSNYTAPSGTSAGAAGIRQLQLRADAPGEFSLHGTLARPWQGDSSAIQRCEITVQASA